MRKAAIAWAIVLAVVLLVGGVALAELWTDKSDYSPGETVTIYGNGMAAGEAVDVYVYYPDGTLAQHNTVTADADGNFEDTYLLPGEDNPVPGVYQVVAVGRSSGNTYTTTFSDAAVTDYSQCRNDVNNDDSPDAVCSWTTGGLNANNSIFREGDVVAHRLIHSGISGAGAHTFVFEYDFTKGGKYAYDFPSSYNATPLTGPFDPSLCAGLSGSGLTLCNTLASNVITVTLPSDTSNGVSSHEPGSPRVWRVGCNPACTAASVVSITPAMGSISGDSSKQITLVVTTTGTTDVGVWMGMHLACGGGFCASGSGWGAGMGAASVSGAPFHYKYISLDGGSVGNRDNQIQIGAVVTPITPTVTTELHTANETVVSIGGSVDLGAVIHDKAIVSPTNVTGTVTFTFYNNGSCQGTGTPAGTVALVNGVAHPSDSVGPLGAGSYSFKAHLNSGNSFKWLDSDSPCEPFTVNKADLSIVTEVHDAGHVDITNGSVSLGSTVHDKAVVSGIVTGFTPTNNVVFTFYDNGSCSGDGVAAGSVAVDSSGVAHPSTAFGPLGAGSYSFQASISGDANYNGATSPCEPFTVNKATPTVTTEIHDSGHTVLQGTEALTNTLHDSATVTSSVGGFTPTGSVSFTFYTNSTCSGTGTSLGTVSLDSAGVAHPSNSVGPLGAGSYSFRASYGGDSNFNPASSPCEPFTISTITINKLANGGNDTFGFTVSGPTSATPSITTSGTPGTGSITLIVLSGSYVVSETTVPSGWQFVGISCNGGTGSFNLAAGSSVTCNVENTRQAATRTQGFWATHTKFTNDTWNSIDWTNIISSSTGVSWTNVFTGSIGFNLCGTKLVTTDKTPSDGDIKAGDSTLMGGFWANISKKSNGTQRSSLDQARMALLQQLLAALLNKYGLGASDGGLVANAINAYCGNNATLIKSYTSQLSAWNQSGDSVPLGFPISAASPKLSQLQADKKFWDTTK